MDNNFYEGDIRGNEPIICPKCHQKLESVYVFGRPEVFFNKDSIKKYKKWV